MRAILIGLLALSLAACASVQRLDAANDVHALLVSIRDNDSATFDAHVDHEALKRELHGQALRTAGAKQEDAGPVGPARPRR